MRPGTTGPKAPRRCSCAELIQCLRRRDITYCKAPEAGLCTNTQEGAKTARASVTANALQNVVVVIVVVIIVAVIVAVGVENDSIKFVVVIVVVVVAAAIVAAAVLSHTQVLHSG